jgi:hypothetical protein
MQESSTIPAPALPKAHKPKPCGHCHEGYQFDGDPADPRTPRYPCEVCQ